jgi:hypothetical protein
MTLSSLKYVPNTDERLDNLAFTILNKLERVFFVAKDGYLDSEKRFGNVMEDPYQAAKFDPLNNAHVSRIKGSALLSNLKIIRNIAEGILLSDSEENHLTEGFSFCGSMGDFSMETFFPLAAYLYHDSQMDYMTDSYEDCDGLKKLLTKFFTRLLMTRSEDEMEELNDYGLWSILGIDDRGFSFKQLALEMGLETERAARGFAGPSAPEHKRISTFKADDSSNRTFIARDEFIRFLDEHSKVNNIKKEGSKITASIQLTKANVKYNHIYLTKVIGMFPKKYIGGSNKLSLAPSQLTLDVGKGKTFKTDIAGDKNIFRTREAIKEFYGNYDVTEGDNVVVTCLKEGNYSLRPA